MAEALGDDPRPRYLMGVGSPIDFFTAVERGVDLFDCVLPTRVARTGQVWTDAGRLNLRNAAHQDDPGPIDPDCACEACRNHSRAYLAHLFRARELLAYRLATVHNVTWTLELMRRLRASLADGSFAELRRWISAAFDRTADHARTRRMTAYDNGVEWLRSRQRSCRDARRRIDQRSGTVAPGFHR